MWLVKLLRSPSSFRHDPNGYLRNQIGHAYIVGGGGVLLLPFAFDLIAWLLPWLVIPDAFALPIVFAGYALWEFSQWHFYRAEIDDCLEDAGHVMLIAVAANFMIWQLVIVHALFLGAGYYWRKGW